MTTYAPNFTPRYKLTYRAGGITHTIQVRGVRGATLATMDAVGAQLSACFNALPAGNKFADLTALSAETALTDSDVFVPAIFVALTVGTLVVSAYSPRARIRGLTFNGRAPGSRAKFTIFGYRQPDELAATEGGDGQILTAEAAAVGTIAGLATTHFRANSGEAAVFAGRATYKENDHLLRLVRKGTIT